MNLLRCSIHCFACGREVDAGIRGGKVIAPGQVIDGYRFCADCVKRHGVNRLKEHLEENKLVITDYEMAENRRRLWELKNKPQG